MNGVRRGVEDTRVEDRVKAHERGRSAKLWAVHSVLRASAELAAAGADGRGLGMKSGYGNRAHTLQALEVGEGVRRDRTLVVGAERSLVQVDM